MQVCKFESVSARKYARNTWIYSSKFIGVERFWQFLGLIIRESASLPAEALFHLSLMRERLTWLARYRIIHICMPMYWVRNEILWNSVKWRISRSRWPCTWGVSINYNPYSTSSEFISDICGFCHEHMTGCELSRSFTSVQLTQKWRLSYLVYGLRGLTLNVLPLSWNLLPNKVCS